MCQMQGERMGVELGGGVETQKLPASSWCCGSCGLALTLCCSVVINRFLWTMSFSPVEAPLNYPRQLWRHQGLMVCSSFPPEDEGAWTALAK